MDERVNEVLPKLTPHKHPINATGNVFAFRVWCLPTFDGVEPVTRICSKRIFTVIFPWSGFTFLQTPPETSVSMAKKNTKCLDGGGVCVCAKLMIFLFTHHIQICLFSSLCEGQDDIVKYSLVLQVFIVTLLLQLLHYSFAIHQWGITWRIIFSGGLTWGIVTTDGKTYDIFGTQVGYGMVVGGSVSFI